MIIKRDIDWEEETVIARIYPETQEEFANIPDFLEFIREEHFILPLGKIGYFVEMEYPLVKVTDTMLIEDSWELAEKLRQDWFETVEGLR